MKEMLTGKTIVDLSLVLDEQLPGTWPGAHPYRHILWKDYTEREPYRTCCFTMDEHCATHCDAPAHFIPDQAEGRYGDSLDLSQMQGSLAVLDVRFLIQENAYGVSPQIEPDLIVQWENEHSPIEKGTICVFRTGWDDYYLVGKAGHHFLEGPVADKNTPGWPTPAVETLVLLYEKGVMCLGIDAPSMGAVQNGAEAHQYALRRKMIFIENLGNLASVPVTGAYFVFLPLKIAESTGCPGRAVAYI